MATIQASVLGFFWRNNLGDDAFQPAFRRLFEYTFKDTNISYKLDFYNTDDIDRLPEGTNVVICGGGDIINEYFISKIGTILENSPLFNGPIFSVGVGITWHNLVGAGFIDLFDKIVLRSSTDFDVASGRLGKSNVYVCPDITAFQFPFRKVFPDPKKGLQVGIYLARPICDNVSGYPAIVKNLAVAFDRLIEEKGATLHFIPFNTRSTNTKENDRIINLDVLEKMNHGSSCILHNTGETFEKVQELIGQTDVGICMRFHGHIFNFMNNIPFVSISFSAKVHKLCSEIEYSDYVYTLPKAEGHCYPKEIDAGILYSYIDKVIQEKDRATSILKKHSEKWEYEATGYASFLLEALKLDDIEFWNNQDRNMKLLKRQGPPHYVFPSVNKKLKAKTCRLMVETIVEGCEYENDEKFILKNSQLLEDGKINPCKILDIVSGITGQQDTHNGVQISSIKREELPGLLSRIVCFQITRQTTPSYFYGLLTQIMDPKFNFRESWDWLTRDWATQEKPDEIKAIQKGDKKRRIGHPLFNLCAVEQLKYNNVHRSGWEYVISNLLPFHDESSPLILDSYLDRSFTWNSEFYKRTKVIPFTKSWIGWIHHTFAREYSENNAYNLIHNPEFIASLPHCKGLFVLSEDLATKVRNELKVVAEEQYIPKVYVLHHPSEIPDDKHLFDFEKFKANPDKKIIQIGCWLRDPFQIYRLPIDKEYKNPMGIRKAVLKGKVMETGFRPKKTFLYLTSDPETKETTTNFTFCNCRCRCFVQWKDTLCPCDKEAMFNKYNAGLIKCIEEMHHSVEIIDRLDNNEYDELLTKNFVFLNLVDCSAANTVIECILRNTVLLVNKHPAVFEYLGKDYPFYYDSLLEASDKARDINLIEQAYIYLQKMDKTFLKIETFVDKFVSIVSSM